MSSDAGIPFNVTVIGVSRTSVAPHGWQYLASSIQIMLWSRFDDASIPLVRACSIPEPSVLLMKTRTSVTSNTGSAFLHIQFARRALQDVLPLCSMCLDIECPHRQILFSRFPRSCLASSDFKASS